MTDNNENKVLNVPHLRFPEFSGEWKKCIIQDYGEVITGNTPPTNNAEYYNNGSYLWASPADLGTGKKINDTKTKLSESGFKKTRIIPKGSILVTCIGSTIGKIGMAVETMSSNQQINSIIVNEKSNNDFVYYAISRAFPRYLSEVGVQAVPILSKSNFEKLPNYTTSIEEQDKTGYFLNLLDERIATQNKIIEDLKKLKSAISQHLFSQEPNVWNRLDNLFVKGKAGGTPISTNKEYYNGNIPFLSINDITRQGKYIWLTEKHISLNGLENSSAWIVPKHSLIMSMYASVGLVTINQVPIATSQAMFSMLLRDKSLLDYLYYYLSYFKYRHIHKYLETGTQSNINADIVSGIMIPDYGYRHNMQIASMLQSIDMKIDNESSILERYSQQKNDLLSSLFI